MPLLNKEQVAEAIKNATVTLDQRVALKEFLATCETDDELFRRSMRKCMAALERFNDKDNHYLNKWLPIIFRKL